MSLNDELSDAARAGHRVLLVPGLNNSGPGHWQTLWEHGNDNFHRVDLGMWEQPHRNTWVNKLHLAIAAADRPVILAAHSLGCLAVAWWAQLAEPETVVKVRAALLVAPPEVDASADGFREIDPRLANFAPMPRDRLPFPAILVASRNDHYMRYNAAAALARDWGCSFADAGRVGHINAESGLGEWTFGAFLLRQLISTASSCRAAEGQATASRDVASGRRDDRGAAGFRSGSAV